MRGSRYSNPTTHLHGFCSVLNPPGKVYHKYTKKAKAPTFHNPVGAFRRKADYKNGRDLG